MLKRHRFKQTVPSPERLADKNALFVAVHESGFGPTQTSAMSALMSADWGKADSLCSTRGFSAPCEDRWCPP